MWLSFRRLLLTALLVLGVSLPAAAQVAYRAGSATSAAFVSSGAPTVDSPTGVTDDDVVVLVCATFNNTDVANVPTGWTQIGVEVDFGGTDGTSAVFQKIAASEPASYTFDTPGDLWAAATSSGICGTLAYSGGHQTTPIDQQAEAANASGTTQESPSITPSVDATVVVSFMARDDGSTQTASPDSSPAATERLDVEEGNNVGIHVQDHTQATAAAISLTHTLDDHADAVSVHIFNIQPPAAGGTEAPAYRLLLQGDGP